MAQDEVKSDDQTLNRNVETGSIPVQDAPDTDSKEKETVDREVPAGAQTAPSDPGADKAEGAAKNTGDLHVVQHLDRDPNDPRTATPTPVLPSLDDAVSQGPEHGRISQEDDHTEAGQNGPTV